MSANSFMLSLQGRIAALALLPILLWGGLYASRSNTASVSPDPVSIGIEHAEPVRVRITRSMGVTPSMVDIEHAGSAETIFVTVPDSWKRGEVRNVPLASVLADPPEFGFTRWQLPPSAIVSFSTPADLTHAVIHNPSGVLLNVDVVTIDVQKNTTDRSSHLVSDQPLSIATP